jgi:IS5 family transposase
LQRHVDAIDAVIASEASVSCLRRMHSRVLVGSELHRQERILLNTKPRNIPDPVVNLVQGQVRPIVRAKARASVASGAKLSAMVDELFAFLQRIGWDPYKDAEDLILQAGKYKEDYGCHPERIHDDRIHIQTQDEDFCKGNNRQRTTLLHGK